jgi:hypothetical protein
MPCGGGGAGVPAYAWAVMTTATPSKTAIFKILDDLFISVYLQSESLQLIYEDPKELHSDYFIIIIFSVFT